ncbi:MAG: ATP-binding domain-containing protein, partial [Apilactobacillus kunkeei]|nr:ATP-binding domain-containing protein [Apilactobacillus kunkeei]
SLNALINCAKQELTEEGTVAIVTKNLKQAKDLHQHIYKQLNPTLLADTDRSLPKGVIVMPIYLAKGLEFDSVIAWDVSKDNFPNNQYIGTLYTIATRAMHHLTLISNGPISPIIANANIPINEVKIDHQQ